MLHILSQFPSDSDIFPDVWFRFSWTVISESDVWLCNDFIMASRSHRTSPINAHIHVANSSNATSMLLYANHL